MSDPEPTKHPIFALWLMVEIVPLLGGLAVIELQQLGSGLKASC